MSRNYQLFLAGCLTVLGMIFVSPVLATDQPGSAVCAVAAAPQGVCGDGVCDAYTGETKANCPQDCKSGGGGGAAAATEQPTLPPLTNTPLPTPTATLGLFLVQPTATALPTETASANLSTTEIAIPTSTAQPQPTAASPTQNGEGCGLVPYESRPAGWQKAYTGNSNNFVPKTSKDQEVFVCDQQPVGQICIPMYEGLMTTVQGQLDQVVLVDCGSDGSCQLHKTRVQSVGGNLCATVTQADHLECSTGCAFLPQQYAVFGIPVPPFLRQLAANQAAIPAICLVGIFLVGFVGLIVFARRRRKDGVDEPTADKTPGVESV